MQDFERAFHAELLLEADLESKQREDFRKLPKWIRQYAYRAWQDRIYFDRNVTWFQQEVVSGHTFCHLSASLVPYSKSSSRQRLSIISTGVIYMYVSGSCTSTPSV